MRADGGLAERLAEADPTELRVIGEEVRARAERVARSDARRLTELREELAVARRAVAVFEPWACWAEGTGEHLRGRPGAAAPLLRRAARLFRRAGDDLTAARVDIALIDAEACLGHHRRALDRGRRALVAFRRAGDRAREVSVLLNLGGLAESRDQVRRAERLWRRARALVDDDDLTRRAALDGNLAVAALALGRFDRALSHYRSAAEAFSRLGATATALAASLGAAETRALMGELGEAVDEARRIDRAAAEIEDSGLGHEARLLVARLELELGHPERARQTATEALAEARAAGHRADAARLAAVAAVAVARGAPGDLEGALDEAVAALRGAGLRVAEAALRVELVRAGASSAANDLGRDVALLGRAGLVVQADLGRLVRARRLAAEGRPQPARALARAILARSPSSVRPAIEAHALLADLGPEGEAIGHLRRAIRLAESVRGRLARAADRATFTAQVAGCYRRLVSRFLARGDARARRQAFDLVARVKSRALVEAIDREGDPAWVGDPELAARWRRLRDELKGALADLEARHDPPTRYSLGVVTGRVSALARRLDELELELGRRDPRSGTLLGRAPEPALGRRLRPGEVFVELFVNGDDLQVFDLRTTGLAVTTVPGVRGDLERRVEGLRFQLSKAAFGRALLERPGAILVGQARSHLAALGELVLEPVYRRGSPRALVVAPHGCLHHLPLAALEMGGRPVLVDGPVAAAPSAGVLARILARPHRRPERLGVAGAGPARLPEIAREVAAVARHGGAGRTIEEATVAEVLDLLATCDAVHLASHGAFQPAAPLGSGLRLADGWLTAMDLLRLPRAAGLMSVGSCSSGRVAVVGEELMGLVRALLETGTTSAVLAHGALDDELARVTAEGLHRELGAVGPGAALRAVQLALREEHPHPALWAAFQLYGNPRPWEGSP